MRGGGSALYNITVYLVDVTKATIVKSKLIVTISLHGTKIFYFFKGGK